MRSTLVRHLWLIQPHENHTPVVPIDAAGGFTVHFSPAWDLLCLRAFLLDRTGHTCSLIDARLHDTLEQAFGLAEQERHPDEGVIAVIYTVTSQLGSVGEIIRYIRQHHPDIPIALFGPHVSAFPGSLALLPGVDFGLAGDPEIKLRHLLDSLDVPHRQRLVPGLILPGSPVKAAHWSPDLRGFSLPNWQTINWADYRHNPGVRGAHIEVRLSRGHTGTSADVAWPRAGEPLRAWPMDRMAQALQKCPGNGINEVFFADPPGFWTNDRLDAWIKSLKNLRNTQPWSLQIVARDVPQTIISELSLIGCHRIEIIIPTIDPHRQAELGMTMPDDLLLDLVTRLRNVAVDPQLIFWVAGPWPVENEVELIAAKVKSLGRPSFAVYNFPFHHDAPLYQRLIDEGGRPPPLDDWLAWAQRGEDREPPVALWSGMGGLAKAESTMHELQRRIGSDPWRTMQKWLPGGESSLKSLLEDRALAAWQRVASRLGGKK